MKISKAVLKQISQYLLNDYEFLQDYIIIPDQKDLDDCGQTLRKIQNGNQGIQQFVAAIVNTKQTVKFNKIPFRQQYLPRFKALCHLYRQGLILADNIFILHETDTYYFYIIEAQLQCTYQAVNSVEPEDDTQPLSESRYGWEDGYCAQSKFKTLHEWIQESSSSFEDKKRIFDKLKVILDHLHSTGQTYNNLTSNKVILDQQNNVYLTPFALNQQLTMDELERAYYAPEMLECLKSIKNNEKIQEEGSLKQVEFKSLIKNDIWAFGCITCELFNFAMPIFYKESIEKQLSFIKEFNNMAEDRDIFTEIWRHQQIGNTILNCLNFDCHKRKISCEQPFQLKLRIMNNKQKQMQPIKKDIKLHSINTEAHEASFSSTDKITLTIKILHLFLPHGYTASKNKQIRINIFLDKQYSVFVNSEMPCFSKKIESSEFQLIQINKSIQIQSEYEELENSLKVPLLFQIQQMGISAMNSCKIRVNLYSLILLSNKQNIWNKPIIGTYSASSNKSEQSESMKIKLSCSLSSQKKTMKLQSQFQVQKHQIQNKLKSDQISDKIQCQRVQKYSEESSAINIKGEQSKRDSCFGSLNQNLLKIAQKWQKKKSNDADQKNITLKKSEQNYCDLKNRIKQILFKRQISV